MMRHLSGLLALAVPVLLLLSPRAAAQSSAAPTPAQAKAADRFRAFLAEDWTAWLKQYPELATEVGYPGLNSYWTDESPAGYDARVQHLHSSLKALQSIDRAALPASETLNYDLYRSVLEMAIEGLQYGFDPYPFASVVPGNRWMPINQMGGIQQGAASTLTDMPRARVSDYEDMLARLKALPTLADQTLAELQAGLAKGYTPPKITMRDVPAQFAGLVPADPLQSPLLAPFTQFPASIPSDDQARLIASAKSIYTASVAPAFEKIRAYLVSTYIPACRDSIAGTALPNGMAAYRYLIRWQTTTDLTPDQIHEIGLSEVKRIHAEMEKVTQSSGFQGSFPEFLQFLRTDPRFYYTRPEDLVDGYRVITKRIDPELAHEFGKLPRLTYGVTPIPDFKAPSQTTGYYQPGAPAAGRPGVYFVNTYKLNQRPKWEMEALSLHESVPGHHFQFALAQELENVPEFRKNLGYSAFSEGWALYSESLGEELGLYKDPYSKFGRLSYEMWRAIRLVVDTGMHSKGWTRQQAIDFFRDNSGKTDQDVTVEVDRYIVWPGQALAYKLGQLKIRELRTRAERELGPNFDVRTFHDTILEQGAVPLGILEQHFNSWLAAQKAVAH